MKEPFRLQRRDLLDYQPHNDFNAEVSQYLESQGFMIRNCGVEKLLDTAALDILKWRTSPTALYIRAHADNLAIHPAFAIEFEWEVKTHANQYFNNWTLEALPLALHTMKSQLGIRCLYVYRNHYQSIDAGFWSDKIPTLNSIYIPARWQAEQQAWFRNLFNQYLPGVPVNTNIRTDGSNTPYALVQESIVRKLSHWKKLIDAALENAKRKDAAA